MPNDLLRGRLPAGPRTDRSIRRNRGQRRPLAVAQQAPGVRTRRVADATLDRARHPPRPGRVARRRPVHQAFTELASTHCGRPSAEIAPLLSAAAEAALFGLTGADLAEQESLKDNRKFQAMLERRGWTIDYDVLK
ncbi:hypothetical protein GCM10010299_35250 [Streptomyces tanashiensis]|uniref:hypothetical protein n=1 Tax=Streptomyces tanashiensis TaxID=67367 RepID=UPI0019BCBE9F|nr:hypothetical protein GCM10010299_35250 [Streptomyces tanashiensis]